MIMAAGLLVPTQAHAVSNVNSTKFRKAVTVSGILAHERALQRIANANDGTRASGTPGYAASGDYVTRKLQAAGYTVTKQEFVFPFYRDLAPAVVSAISPTPADYATASFTYSGSGDVTGPLVPTNDVQIPPGPTASSSNSGCQPDDFAPAPSGPSVALAQRGTCEFAVKADNAAAAGYDALIIFNEGQPGREELLTGTLSAPKSIPVVGLSFADGAALYAQTRAGAVTVNVATSTETDLDATTFNLLAETPRGKKKGEAIVVGAHLDSVVDGPGINDNGSGTSAILEIAEQLAKPKFAKHLQRPVRFAFFGAEENGLLGSEHYVASLDEDELSKIYANLNFDMLGSPNYVRFVYDGDGSDTPAAGPAGSAEIEDVFTDYFAKRGLATEPTAFNGRSDYGPFIAAGIPAGGLFSGAEGVKTDAQAAVYGGTAGQAYDPCYHQACDTISNLSTTALYELGDAAAHATFVLSTSKKGLYPDGSGVSASSKRAGVTTAEKIASR